LTDIIPRLCERCHTAPVENGGFCVNCLASMVADNEGETIDLVAHEAPVFPEDALIGPLGDVVRALIPQTEAPPPFLWFDLLTTFGCCVGPAPYIYQGSRQPLRCFTLCVGPTGAGRKGTSRGLIADLFDEVDSGLPIMAGISSGEGLIEAVADPWKNKKGELTGGTTDKRLLFIDEEFTRTHTIAHRSGSAVGPMLRIAWDWRDLVNPKVEGRRATKPHVCAITHCTPEELSAIVGMVDVYNGFINRYCIVWGEREKKLSRAVAPTGLALAHATSGLRRAVDTARRINAMEWSESAGAMWDEIYEKDEGEEGYVGALLQRKLAYITRYAAILSAADGCRQIELSHIKSAWLTWSYVDASTRYVVGKYSIGSSKAVAKGIEMAESRQTEARVTRLFGKLAVAQDAGLSRSEISRGVFSGNVPTAELDGLLRALIVEGRIKKQETKGRGGRGGVAERYWLLGFGPSNGA
jgi:hypothetical protein